MARPPIRSPRQDALRDFPSFTPEYSRHGVELYSAAIIYMQELTGGIEQTLTTINMNSGSLKTAEEVEFAVKANDVMTCNTDHNPREAHEFQLMDDPLVAEKPGAATLLSIFVGLITTKRIYDN